jgi:large subunit ribosomal protein L16
MFIPKRSKFKKQQKGITPNSISGLNYVNQLAFGSIGLKAVSFCRLNSKQIETIKKIIGKQIKKTGRLVIHAFPNVSISQKSVENRMGKGKGNVDHWIFKIKPGFIFCEIITDQVEIAKKALISVIKRMSLKVRIISN